jgi:hypothetical protein
MEILNISLAEEEEGGGAAAAGFAVLVQPSLTAFTYSFHTNVRNV